jgi:type IV secretory pathway TraG/TraD family ATPase VirD4
MYPNLLTFKGQIITIDVKGENAIAAGRQEEGPPNA